MRAGSLIIESILAPHTALGSIWFSPATQAILQHYDNFQLGNVAKAIRQQASALSWSSSLARVGHW
jgi:hypothetical protein